MKRSEIEVVDFGCPLRPCFPLFSPVSPFQSGSAGAGTLPGEAYACSHPRCRRQPRPDAVPPRFRDRCYPCRRKSRSRIIRYGVIRASVLGCTPRLAPPRSAFSSATKYSGRGPEEMRWRKLRANANLQQIQAISPCSPGGCQGRRRNYRAGRPRNRPRRGRRCQFVCC